MHVHIWVMFVLPVSLLITSSAQAHLLHYTCMDVTLLLNLPSPLEEWRVSDEATLSDHNCIDFSLGLGLHSYTEAVPNLAKANWDKFQEILNKSFRDPQYVVY